MLSTAEETLSTAEESRTWVRPGLRGYGCGSKPMVPFGGRYTTHFRTYFSGDWDVHWGTDLAFDPWAYLVKKRGRQPPWLQLGGSRV